jgi:hypothetical protein
MEDDDGHGWKIVNNRNRSGIGFNQFKPDIATSWNLKKDKIDSATTFFFTDFPERYGAKALFNALDNYGDILEVVIPVKRDKGGRRFGFARFDRVTDPHSFENALNNAIIGGCQISANLSRFQRPAEKDHNQTLDAERRGRTREFQPQRTRLRSKSIKHHSIVRDNDSFAQVVRFGKGPNPMDTSQKVILKYEAEKKEMERLSKSFVGIVTNPGTTYNIQNAFHSQGYFGVKVTPLGANLTLLEGQEDGEVEALMADAKDWLEQWFSEIRPWNPKDVDLERIVWLRIYGIPVHAWNDEFFNQLTKPWGTFMHSDEVTRKKATMDVARVLIRTSCQKVIDEFCDVHINGNFFHLRVLEDSYGPMRIMVTQEKGHDGRDNSRSSSEADEEDDIVRLSEAVEEESEKESEGEGENLLSLNGDINANNANNALVIEKEGLKENSNSSFNDNNVILIENNLNLGESVLNLNGGGINKEIIMDVNNVNEVGQEHVTSKGGVDRRSAVSEDMGRRGKPNFVQEGELVGTGKRKGGVYSDGPRSVYNRLATGPILQPIEKLNPLHKKHKNLIKSSVVLPSSALRKQQQLARSICSRKTNSVSAVSATNFNCSEREGGSSVGGVRRNEAAVCNSSEGSSKIIKFSGSSARNTSGSSSINSSDIRNCNRLFLKKFEQEVASKVWNGALTLGVEAAGVSVDGSKVNGHGLGEPVDCIKEIKANEKRDEVESIRREHRNFVYQ